MGSSITVNYPLTIIDDTETAVTIPQESPSLSKPIISNVLPETECSLKDALFHTLCLITLKALGNMRHVR